MARGPRWQKTFNPARTPGTKTRARLDAYLTHDWFGRRKLNNAMAPIPKSDHDEETLDLDAIFMESQTRCVTRIAEHTQRMRDRMAEEGPYIKASDLTLEEIRK